jgi:hypothetical protein
MAEGTNQNVSEKSFWCWSGKGYPIYGGPREKMSEQPPLGMMTGAQATWEDVKREQARRWARAYGPNDDCVQVEGLTFTVNISAKAVADKINAALAAAKQEGIDWADKQYYGVSGHKRIRELEEQLAAEREERKKTSISRDLWEDTAKEIDKQLAAEREKLDERKAANDVLRAENRGLFAKCEELEKANKKFEIVILEGEEAVDSALRDEVKQLREQLAAERDNAEAWRLVAKGKEGAYVKMEQQLAAALAKAEERPRHVLD